MGARDWRFRTFGFLGSRGHGRAGSGCARA